MLGKICILEIAFKCSESVVSTLNHISQSKHSTYKKCQPLLTFFRRIPQTHSTTVQYQTIEKKKKKLNKSRFKKRLAYQVLSLILYWYKCNFKRPVPARFFISKVLLSEKSLRLSNLDVECSDFWMLIIS